MKISELVGKFDLRDSQPFFDFTKKWIDYVITKKTSAQISTDEWSELFGRRNPVAGIDRGELLDEVKISNGQMRKTNEKKSIISNWDNSIRPLIEATISITDSSSKIAKIKDLEKLLHRTIKEEGGRNMVIAINRILATFFPDYFVSIPNYENLKEFIDLLNKYIDNGASIVRTNNWIDDCYQVKKFFDNELNDDHLTASAWRFYEYIQEIHTIGTATIVNTSTKLNMKEIKIGEINIIRHLEANHNIILHGAPGTGKTYLAKEIAKAMCDVDDIKKLEDSGQFKMVQFHPSYDYTDFVEGLRPDDNSNDNIVFVRKDGVFKEFCKKAVKNLNISEQTEDEFKKDRTIEYAYQDLIDQIRNEEVKSIPLKTDNKEAIFHSVSERDSIIFEQKTDKGPSRNVVSLNRLLKLAQKFKDIASLDAMKDISKDVRAAIGGCNSTWYWATLRHLYKMMQNSNNNKTENQVKKEIKKNFIFLIDEINRGDMSKIFGELFYAIDPGYRGVDGKIDTQYQNLLKDSGDDFEDGFYVPDNVYIIGTMNDIDRSVESMDFAMRRRFQFIEITAEDRAYGMGLKKDENTKADYTTKDAYARMTNLNNCIISKEIGLSKAYQIGGSYFLKKKIENSKKISVPIASDDEFKNLWDYRLKGLLREYLRGEEDKVIEEKLENILKPAFNLHDGHSYNTKGEKVKNTESVIPENTTTDE